ncbi:ORF6N domain-containing protein [Clostridium sp.]|uniref:ORF6N domain-containing protein n=1 Tax=Clostridium sp. TaxID=1506 RepID=UPI0039928EEC
MTNEKLIKNLEIKGTTEFMGLELPNIFGGFGQDKKCILAKDIAEIHDTRIDKINELINNNIDEFEFGVDIIDLKVNLSTDYNFKTLGFTKMQVSKAKNIYLLSEQGYMALVMLMRTDKAKEIRKQLRREYFYLKEEVQAVTKIAESTAETLKKLNEHRFSNKRTIKTFENTDILHMPNLLLEFNNYINTLPPVKRLPLYKSSIKGIERAVNKMASNPAMLPYICIANNNKELLLKAKNKLENKRNGGLKTGLKKKITALEQTIESIAPNFSKYKCVDTHGMSVNHLFETKIDLFTDRLITTKTVAYRKWLDKFPIEQIKGFENVDWSKEVNLYLKFVAKEGYDADNLIKSFVDTLSKYYNKGEDNTVQIKEAVIIDRCKDYNEGKIYFYMCN